MPDSNLPKIRCALSDFGTRSTTVALKYATWPKIAEYLTKDRILSSGNKLNNELFFAGTFRGVRDATGRVPRRGGIESRTMLTFDIDECDLTFDDVEELLISKWHGCYVLYTTWSHRGKGRMRIFIPLDRLVTLAEYKVYSVQVAKELGIYKYCDPCSWSPAEGMFVYGTDDEGVPYRRKSICTEGPFWPVPGLIKGAVEPEEIVEDPADALLDEVRRESFTDDKVDELLFHYDPEGLHYDDWLRVGSALNWRYEGDVKGYERWLHWSERSSKHIEQGMRTKWDSFDPYAKKPVTLASIVMKVKGQSLSKVLAELSDDNVAGSEGGDEGTDAITEAYDAHVVKSKDIAVPESKGKEGALHLAIDRLVARAKAIETDDEYREVLRLIHGFEGQRILPTDIDRLATAMCKSIYGLEEGIGKVPSRKTIERQLGYKSAQEFNVGVGTGAEVDENGNVIGGTGKGAPAWCSQWCFILNEDAFYNLHTLDIVKKSAFDTQYASDPLVLGEEGPSASKLVAMRGWVPCVDSRAFHPMKGLFFSEVSGSETIRYVGSDTGVLREARRMVNTYCPPALEPASDERMATPEAQAAIERLLWHTHFLIGDKRQESILFDWLAHNIQFPGKKITWAVLLQGFYGTGKTYYYQMLRYIFGGYANLINDNDIASGFNAWATGYLINCIEEIRNKTNKYEVVEALKTHISNENVTVTAKGRDPRTLPNFTNYLAFTNYEDAIPMDDGDRRYFVIFSRIKNQDQLRTELVHRVRALGLEMRMDDMAAISAYFQQLYEDLREFKDVFYRYFLDRQISDSFCATGIAPMSDAKQAMIDNSIPQYVLDVHNAIARHDDCPVISEHIVDVATLVKLSQGIDELPKTYLLGKGLAQLGYRQLRGKRGNKIGKKMRTVYVKDISDDEAMEICKEYPFDLTD